MRKLRLLGHVCRLAEETPVKPPLREALKCQRNRIGWPKSTWIKQVKKDLENRGTIAHSNFGNVITLAKDRDIWRKYYGSLDDNRQPDGVGCANEKRNPLNMWRWWWVEFEEQQ